MGRRQLACAAAFVKVSGADFDSVLTCLGDG